MRLTRFLLGLIVLCGVLPTVSMAQDSPLDVGISLPPSLNFATSPNPVGSGARAAGKAFAFIAVADDATAASWNPAGLVQLQQPEVSVVGSYFIRLEDQDITDSSSVLSIDGQSIDSFNLNYLSVVYPFEIFKRNVVVSLNVQRLFDLNGKTDVTSGFTDIDGTQQVRSDQDGGIWTISPAVAVQITPKFSVGVAFNIWPDIFGNGWVLADASARCECGAGVNRRLSAIRGCWRSFRCASRRPLGCTGRRPSRLYARDARLVPHCPAGPGFGACFPRDGCGRHRVQRSDLGSPRGGAGFGRGGCRPGSRACRQWIVHVDVP